ncbi:MAG: TolB family protein, partial [Anaerolineales bacterium]
EATPSVEKDIVEPMIQDLHTQGGWPNYVWRLVYPAIPSDVNELTLLIPILQTMPADAAPENWQITFRLKAAPPDFTMVPVIQVDSTSIVTSTTSANLFSPKETQYLSGTSSERGFTFQLDNIIELKDGFVLSGDLSWQNSAFSAPGSVSGFSKPRLVDRNGSEIPIEEVPVDYYGDENSRNWSYRTNQKGFAAPLTLIFHSIETILYPKRINLDIDLGDHPQIGMRWEVNQDYSIEGHSLQLLYVELKQLDGDTCWRYTLLFHFKTDDEHLTAGIEDSVPQIPLQRICGGGGGGGPVTDPTIFMAGVPYPTIPQGIHHFQIIPAINTVVSGPWELAWEPPSTVEETPTPTAQICLTKEIWNQLKDQNQALPPGLQGKFVATLPDNTIQIFGLDGNVIQSIPNGNWPALANDGTALAYSGVEGNIHIMDFAHGFSTITNTGGYNPIWSPDNQRILFTNTYNLFIVNRDGSNLEKIETGTNQILSVVGWLDNDTIVYGVLGGEGFTFTKQNLLSGERTPLFTIQQKAGYGAISPDGKWIVFADKVFGADNWGIFISKIDGSDRRMIVSPEIATAFKTLWSPDGKWLLVNSVDSAYTPIPILINPFDCKVVPLRQLRQTIDYWR